MLLLLLSLVYANSFTNTNYINECLSNYKDNNIRRMCIKSGYYENMYFNTMEKLNICYQKKN